MSNGEFSGKSEVEFEFAAGCVYGLRSWKIDDAGRLRGISYEEIWRPGENVSVCKAKKTELVGTCPKYKPKDADKKPSPEPPGYNSWFVRYVTPGRAACPTVDGVYCDGYVHRRNTDPGHHFDPACHCGFWAYDDQDLFGPGGQVSGVISGYGKVTIGTKGFRVEKARIVGLSRNQPLGRYDDDDYDNGPRRVRDRRWARLQQLYPGVVFADTIEELTERFPLNPSWPDETASDFWVPEPVNTVTVGPGQLSSYIYNAMLVGNPVAQSQGLDDIALGDGESVTITTESELSDDS